MSKQIDLHEICDILADREIDFLAKNEKGYPNSIYTIRPNSKIRFYKGEWLDQYKNSFREFWDIFEDLGYEDYDYK